MDKIDVGHVRNDSARNYRRLERKALAKRRAQEAAIEQAFSGFKHPGERVFSDLYLGEFVDELYPFPKGLE